MEETRKVINCINCPFSSWSFSGGRGSRRRLQHKCNLQKTGVQWKKEGAYDCFSNCPLKNKSYVIVM